MSHSAPYLQWIIAPASDAYDAVRALDPAGRLVRGSRSLTKAALLDEMAAALQFPPHFGGNWDALNDALCDPHERGWTVGILDAGKVLSKSGSDDLVKFVAVLNGVAEQMARVKKPFRVLLHEVSADLAAAQKRWAAAGVTVT